MCDFQKLVKDFSQQYNMTCPLEYKVIDLQAELGDVCRELLMSSYYGQKKAEVTPELKAKLGDIFFTLIALANEADVDLETELKEVLKKHEEFAACGCGHEECK